MSMIAPGTYLVGILQRAIQPETADLSPDQARAWLAVRFSAADLDRVDALCAKSRTGTLFAEEKQELEEYLEADALVGFLQSKARQSLKLAGLDR